MKTKTNRKPRRTTRREFFLDGLMSEVAARALNLEIVGPFTPSAKHAKMLSEVQFDPSPEDCVACPLGHTGPAVESAYNAKILECTVCGVLWHRIAPVHRS
jgi:hypothetical protein